MAGLQNLAESLAAAAQIDPNGDHARIQDGGDFPHRVVGVIEKDHGCPLMSRQLLERPDQLPVQVGHFLGSGAIQAHGSAPLLQHAARDPEGSPPYPGGGRADRATPGERLGKGFSHGVTGYIRVLRECPDSAPYSVAMCSIHVFNRGMARGDRVLHCLKGAVGRQKLPATGVSPPPARIWPRPNQVSRVWVDGATATGTRNEDEAAVAEPNWWRPGGKSAGNPRLPLRFRPVRFMTTGSETGFHASRGWHDGHPGRDLSL